jgi:hypothetical protein
MATATKPKKMRRAMTTPTMAPVDNGFPLISAWIPSLLIGVGEFVGKGTGPDVDGCERTLLVVEDARARNSCSVYSIGVPELAQLDSAVK